MRFELTFATCKAGLNRNLAGKTHHTQSHSYLLLTLICAHRVLTHCSLCPARGAAYPGPMPENTCYALAELDNGVPVGYLSFMGVGWTPGSRFNLTTDRGPAWRFGDRQRAEETATLINSVPTNRVELHVIEIDCDGPPLNTPAPPTLE